jgi:hypothetical protein
VYFNGKSYSAFLAELQYRMSCQFSWP